MRRRTVGRSLIIGSALVAPALCALAGACRPARLSDAELRARVVSALGSVRPFEARLYGVPYAPLGSASPGPARVVALLGQEVERRGSPQALATKALLEVVDPAPERRRHAMTLLTRARDLAPADAAIASDLAAVDLAGGGPDSARSLMAALESARAAVQLAPGLPEARFNLALALERLFLTRQAKRAWEAYLRADPRSRWADEARQHERALDETAAASAWQRARSGLESAVRTGDAATVRRLVAGHRLRARRYGEITLLQRWADNLRDGHEEVARSALTVAREIGRAYEGVAGDSMLLETVAAIDLAGQTRRLSHLVKGHHDFSRAMDAYQRFDRAAAAALFRSSAMELRRGRSPFQAWAKLYLAACDYQANRYRRALAALDALEEESTHRHYPNLMGRAEWIRGLVRTVLDQPIAARENFRAALEAFVGSGELGHQAVIHCLFADTDDLLGDERAAWPHLYRSLALADDLEDARARQLIAMMATQQALAERMTGAGLTFQDEAVQWALVSGNPIQVALALRDRGSLDMQADRRPDAERDLAAALYWARSANDPGLLAEVQVLQAHLHWVDDPEAALRSVSAALPVLIETHYVKSLTSAYLLRGRLRASTGDVDLAVADFKAGIDQAEHTFELLDDTSRLPFLDRSSDLFDEMIQLEARREKVPLRNAFSYAERGRARALGELLAKRRRAGESRWLELAEVARELPGDRTLVEYSLLPDRLIAWVTSRGSSRAHVEAISRQQIEQRIAHLDAEISSGSETTAELGDLYRILIAPLSLPRNERLVIVADKSLHQLPFGALRDPATGRFLIEDHALELSPSATTYLAGVPRCQQRHPASRSVLLVVADPAFDRAQADHLPRLPQAAAEAGELARLYGGADILSGLDATKVQVLAAIGTHRIVHFGVHAQIDSRSPLFSRLLLAPSATDSGVLLGRDLYDSKFCAVELVVLAACETAMERVADSEGVSGFTRPFLAAGVPAVIGSLWSVNDSDAARFSRELHRALVAGNDPAEALHTAETALLHSTDPALRQLHAWAGYTLYSRLVTASRPSG